MNEKVTYFRTTFALKKNMGNRVITIPKNSGCAINKLVNLAWFARVTSVG